MEVPPLDKGGVGEGNGRHRVHCLVLMGRPARFCSLTVLNGKVVFAKYRILKACPFLVFGGAGIDSLKFLFLVSNYIYQKHVTYFYSLVSTNYRPANHLNEINL